MKLNIFPKFIFFLLIVPLVDVFLYLLICFSLHSGFIYQAGFQVETPSSNLRIPIKQKPLLITVIASKPMRIYCNNQYLSLEKLSFFLENTFIFKEGSKKSAFLRLDKNLSIKEQNQIIDILYKHSFDIFLLSSDV